MFSFRYFSLHSISCREMCHTIAKHVLYSCFQANYKSLLLNYFIFFFFWRNTYWFIAYSICTLLLHFNLPKSVFYLLAKAARFPCIQHIQPISFSFSLAFLLCSLLFGSVLHRIFPTSDLTLQLFFVYISFPPYGGEHFADVKWQPCLSYGVVFSVLAFFLSVCAFFFNTK